jgi:hypothetical protein
MTDDILPLLDLPTETEIMRDGLVAMSRAFHPHGIFWRVNVGEAWAGHGQRISKPTVVRLPAGAVVIRKASRITFGSPGQPDTMGCLHGRFVGIEWKTESGTQRKTQEDWEAAAVRAGGIYRIVRSADEAVAFLRATVAEGGWDR